MNKPTTFDDVNNLRNKIIQEIISLLKNADVQNLWLDTEIEHDDYFEVKTIFWNFNFDNWEEFIVKGVELNNDGTDVILIVSNEESPNDHYRYSIYSEFAGGNLYFLLDLRDAINIALRLTLE